MLSVVPVEPVVNVRVGVGPAAPVDPQLAPVPTTKRDPAFVAAVIHMGEIRPYALGSLDAEKGEPCCPRTYYPTDAFAQEQYQAGYYQTRDADEIDAYLSEMLCKPGLTDHVPMSAHHDPSFASDWAAFVAQEAEDLEEARLDEEFWSRGMW